MKGGCVAAVLVTVVFAAIFAASQTAGVLIVWGVAVVLLWRAVDKRVSDSSATPPLVAVAPSEDVYAGDTGEIDRVERGPEGVMFIVHPKRTEVPRRG